LQFDANYLQSQAILHANRQFSPLKYRQFDRYYLIDRTSNRPRLSHFHSSDRLSRERGTAFLMVIWSARSDSTATPARTR